MSWYLLEADHGTEQQSQTHCLILRVNSQLILMQTQ